MFLLVILHTAFPLPKAIYNIQQEQCVGATVTQKLPTNSKVEHDSLQIALQAQTNISGLQMFLNVSWIVLPIRKENIMSSTD